MVEPSVRSGFMAVIESNTALVHGPLNIHECLGDGFHSDELLHQAGNDCSIENRTVSVLDAKNAR